MENPNQLSELLEETRALEAAGQSDTAIQRLRNGLDLKPAHFTGWLALSRFLFNSKRYEEAVQAAKSTESIDPLAGQFQKIRQSMQARDAEGAKKTAESMLQTQPDNPRALFTLAHLCQSRGDFDAAIELLDRALKASPADLTLRSMVVGALEQAGRYREALEAARWVSLLDPGFQSLWGMINLLLRYGQNKLALTACDQLDALAGLSPPQQSATALVRAQVLRIVGHRDESITAFRRSLELNPNNANAWWGLADLKTYKFSDLDRSQMAKLVDRQDIHPHEKCMTAFALAKAGERAEDPTSAMAQYHIANQLHPAKRFNAEGFASAVTRIKTLVTADSLKGQAPKRPGSPRPIFILGLPRSGSTLVEQILASHSQVEGTMEQPTLPALKQRAHLICLHQLGGDYLSRLGQLPPSVLADLGDRYLEESRLFRPQAAPVFTDKLPHNFEHAGFIHKILPDAVIIDTRRNPMDCGYSLYKQYFTQGTDFSYSLESIGQYYKGYLDIMDHWHAVLPGRILTLQYEQLVADPETQVRALLAHADLDYEQTCLDFHKTKRAVRTASSEQVRQPLNSKGIGAWKAVEAELEPLKAALGETTLKRFDLYL